MLGILSPLFSSNFIYSVECSHFQTFYSFNFSKSQFPFWILLPWHSLFHSYGSPSHLFWYHLFYVADFHVRTCLEFICLCVSSLRFFIIFTSKLLKSLCNILPLLVSFHSSVKELWSLGGGLSPCYLVSLAVLWYDLCICWTSHLVDLGIFLLSNLLLRAYTPVPVSGEKTSCQNGIGSEWTRNIGIDLRSVNDHWCHQWPRTRKMGKLMWSVPPGPLQAAAQLALCLARLILHAMPTFGSALFRNPVTASVHFWITSSFSSSNSV